jgi:hypothetical protein
MTDKKRKQTAQQKLNNFLRSDLAKTYPLCVAQIITLHALASYCYYNEQCNPSIPALMEYTCLCDSYIREKLLKLEALGLIKIKRKNGCRNEYLWLVPYVPDEDIYRKKSVNKSGKTKNKSKTPPLQRGGYPAATEGGLH